MLLIVVAACGGNTENDGGNEQVKVITTIYPIEYFTERIGGGLIEVENLLPRGVEAHDFEPSVSNLAAIADSDLIIYNGADFEPWVERSLDSLGDQAPTAAEASRLVADEFIAGDDQHDADPHLWLSPILAARQVTSISDALAQLDAASADVFGENRDQLITELDLLDQQLRSGLSSCVHEAFVTSHSAYGYLADEYELRQIAISGLSPDAEPGPATLADIAVQMNQLGLSYVLVEPIVNSRIAETLAREVGASTLPLHPLETLTFEEQDSGADYFSIMENNLGSLRIALDCEA